MSEIKEAQKEAEEKLEMWRRAAFLYERERFSTKTDIFWRQYEMFFALYDLICAVGGLEYLDDDGEAGQ